MERVLNGDDVALVGDVIGNTILTTFYDSVVKALIKYRTYCVEDDFVFTDRNNASEYAIEKWEEFKGCSLSYLDSVVYFDKGDTCDTCLAKEMEVYVEQGVTCVIITQRSRDVFHKDVYIIQIKTPAIVTS